MAHRVWLSLAAGQVTGSVSGLGVNFYHARGGFVGIPKKKDACKACSGTVRCHAHTMCGPCRQSKLLNSSYHLRSWFREGSGNFAYKRSRENSTSNLRSTLCRGSGGISATVWQEEERAEQGTELGETRENDYLDSEVDVNSTSNVLEESLVLFEWPAVCMQVTQFASTAMGKSGNLPVGNDQEQSEELLNITDAAMALPKPLDFSGIESLAGIVESAISGTVCDIKEFRVVRSTLQGVQNLYAQLFDSGSEKISPLQSILGNADLCLSLMDSIEHAIDVTLETILDRASPALEAARVARKANLKALDLFLTQTATLVVQQGGMDSVVVTRRRARSCIAVRSSHKFLLPGGITLDVSNTGSTSFVEPEPALIMNNEEMRLAGTEKAEELAVLGDLTRKVVDKAEAIVELMGRITIIDLACARASHAKWLGSVRPKFYTHQPTTGEGKVQKDDFVVDIDDIRHPLLLGSSLPKLPVLERLGTNRSKSFSARESVESSDWKQTFSEGEIGSFKPVPIDLKVKSDVRVVTITGPNTGGKTATLKTLGVAALMAKAGLFLPAVGYPTLPWFDYVVADVGDEQSLERNLSTFSGHVRRLREILRVSTGRSLVLLDEVGGGTDPTEGAALATAILNHLCHHVRLCVATTHSAELKVLNAQDSKFENASVEFDIETLRPTYKVLWGVAGQSNALDIATSLGFDPKVLSRAKSLLAMMKPSQVGARTTELLESLVKQRDEQLERTKQASAVLLDSQNLYNELSAAVTDLPKRLSASKRSLDQAVEDDVARCKLELDQVVENFQSISGSGEALGLRNVQSQISSIVEGYSRSKLGNGALECLPVSLLTAKSALAASSSPDTFTVGEQVLVKKLSRSPVSVVEVSGEGEYISVQLGSLKMQVKVNEIVKVKGTGIKKAEQQVQEKILRKAKATARADSTAYADDYEVAVQTSKNTLDLRGMTVEDAVQELNLKLHGRRPKSVLFVVHGIGTGAVKAAVLNVLSKHPYVARFEDESIRNAGCTIVYIQ